MILCPACEHENLLGADQCVNCHVNLTDISVPTANTQIKKRIMVDPIGKANLREPIIVSRETSAKEVVQKMKDMRRGCALVVENNELVGIFTERDLLKKLAKPDIDLSEIEIQNVMTPSPEVLSEDNTMAFALNKMSMGNFRHVPVRKHDGSITYFSVADILSYFF